MDWSSEQLAQLDQAAQNVGRALARRLQRDRPGPWRKRWWDERLIEAAMSEPAVKVQLFRFVDALPALPSDQLLVRRLHEYLLPVRDRMPSWLRPLVWASEPDSLWRSPLAAAVRANSRALARRFVAGANAHEVLAEARRRRSLRRAFTLDVLGEAVVSEVEAERHFATCLTLLEEFAPRTDDWPAIPQIDRDARGRLPRFNLSVKLSALDPHFDPLDRPGVLKRSGGRLRKLFAAARAQGAFVNVDMESYAGKDLTLDVFREVAGSADFQDFADVGVVVQAYLRDSERDLAALIEFARRRAAPIWIRLVKGAYWDYETTIAGQHGWPSPVFDHKWETDANFEKLTRMLLAASDAVRPAIGSHNLRSIAYAMAVHEQLGLPQADLEIQMLYGMGDEEKNAIADAGWRLREYLPFGDLLPGMAYLVRRLLENTSNDSFLRASFHDDADLGDLLISPESAGKRSSATSDGAARPVLASSPSDEFPGNRAMDFHNEPTWNFSLAEPRAALAQALVDVAGRFGGDRPLVIGGERIVTEEWIESINPSHRRQVLGRVAAAGVDEAARAVAAAGGAATAWRRAGVATRAARLRRLADILSDRRAELAAWIIHEVGKPWRDADAEVCEAIDFCRYYAASAEELFSAGGVDAPGEENRVDYLPRGVAAVIAPWNFPLAILTGMTTAAAVCGCPVVMKPAEQASLVAAELMQAIEDAGFPPGVVNYLPGPGETVGAALVDHPDVAVIAFTGSRDVGLHLHARAAALSQTGARGVKQVIAEMGGKNAILIDEDADLDEAVLGVVGSAFGYAGQKCSACSRAIVVGKIYDEFLGRLVEATRSLRVLPAEDSASDLGPVVDHESLARIQEYLELGRQEAQLALEIPLGGLAEEGYYVGPRLFVDVSPRARIAQEEIFGPVLSVLRADSIAAAVEIANDVDYALTAGVFSRSPANLEFVRGELAAGNVYLNRGVTGALVQRQPFGGFKLSGVGSKAGGPDYLRQFVVPRVVTENTLRRGFAPEGD